MARRYPEAIDESGRLLLQDPDFPSARHFLEAALWHGGRREEALAEDRRLWIDDAELRAAANPERNPVEVAHTVADELARRATASDRVKPLEVAAWYARAKATDAAFEWLETAYEHRIPHLIFLRVNPNWDPLRSDPRLDELARRIGLPE